jgi:uncharacterized protein YbcV (DUF1398 family)
MFSVEQIEAAHRKVKSGIDFPSYIREIKELGVTRYETYVADGHVDYYGANQYTAIVPGKYEPLVIVDSPKVEVFKAEFLVHQLGKTDYLTFVRKCAEAGIEKWEICMNKMTCTYFDREGNVVLVEQIPQ